MPACRISWSTLQTNGSPKGGYHIGFPLILRPIAENMNDTVSLQYMCCEIVHFLYLLSLFDSFILLFVHMYEYIILEL